MTTRNKFLGFIIGVLIISNIALFAIGFLNGPRNNGSQGPKKEIIKKLNFDDRQKSEFKKLIDLHREKLGEKHKKLQALKIDLFRMLKSDQSEEQTLEIQRQLAQVHLELEMVHYNHTKDIRKLCNEEQLKNFDAMIEEEMSSKNFKRPPKREK